MEEIKTVNVDEMVEHVDASELDVIYDEYSGEDFDGLAAKILLAMTAGAVGLGALAFAKRDKIRDWRIKRWEKKGYKVEKIEPVEETIVDTTVETEHVETTDVETKKKKKNK